MVKVKVFSSLLAADFSVIESELKKVEEAGADAVHLDVMDNRYVPNKSFPIEKIKSFYEKISLPIDIHLMIEKPEDFVDQFLEFNPAYLSFHAETAKNPEELIEKIKQNNCKAGLAVNAKVSLDSILPFLSLIDFVLVMTVNAGFGGQKFIEENIKKIEELNKIRKEKNLVFEIEVDGGVNTENSKKLVQAGTDILVSGSAVFKSDSVSETIKKLKN